MRKSRSFMASGFDASKAAWSSATSPPSVATGVIHGHKRSSSPPTSPPSRLLYNATITPLVKDIQNTTTPSDQVYLDQQQISIRSTNMVNGLGNQLAKQLHSKMYTRIRTVVTGALRIRAPSDSPARHPRQAACSPLSTRCPRRDGHPGPRE